MKGKLPLDRRRVPKPAQETPTGYRLPLAKRGDFFAFLASAVVSADSYSLKQFVADFPDDGACLEWLWRHRHAPDGTHAECPRCDRPSQFRRYATTQQRQAWTCTGCGHHLHPTAGTLFHKSSTTLDLWFLAIYLLAASRGRVSARRLQSELGVTYKTAWRIKTLLLRELQPRPEGDPV